MQRVSAVYVLSFFLFALGHFVIEPPDSYEAWRDWVQSPAVSVMAAVFVAALLAHAWVGLRDVLMDYAHATFVRFLALAILALGLGGAGAWFLRILWSARGA